jgi:HK97 family phage prohead protease
VSEILIRSAEVLTRSDGVLADVHPLERLIDVIAVPWGEEARVFWRGDFWTEIIERGAFDGIETRAGRVRVNREHTKGDTVGKIVEFNPAHERGLFVRVKIADTPRGHETLKLAEEDMISASIGYRTNKPSDVVVDKRAMTRRVRAAYLDHLGMVEDPAFKDARVLAVREDEPAVVDGPLPETPWLDEMMQDPIILWAMQRKAS